MAKVRRSAPAAIVIDVSSSSEQSEGGEEVAVCWPPPRGGKRGRRAPSVLDEGEVWTPRQKRRIDDDCRILPADPFAAQAVPSAAATDDVAVIAERGMVACRDFPHSRCTCAKYPFNNTSHESYCEQCFCYVCDIAAPCVSWKGPAGHCHASHKDKKWKYMRSARQRQRK